MKIAIFWAGVVWLMCGLFTLGAVISVAERQGTTDTFFEAMGPVTVVLAWPLMAGAYWEHTDYGR